jgi:hypothetical protein
MEDYPDFMAVMSSQERRVSHGILEGRPWAMDNSAFTTGFDWDKFLTAIERYRPFLDSCLFIVLPDVVGDAEATRVLYDQWHSTFRATGFPIAYVLQDGQESIPIPKNVDCWFLGGTNKFKLSKQAWKILEYGRSLGKWIHVGRVNSLKRVLHFDGIADSVDGNHHKFEPDKALKRIIYWMEVANALRAKQSHMACPVLPGQYPARQLVGYSVRTHSLGSTGVPGWSRGNRSDILSQGHGANPLGEVGVLDLDVGSRSNNSTC